MSRLLTSFAIILLFPAFALAAETSSADAQPQVITFLRYLIGLRVPEFLLAALSVATIALLLERIHALIIRREEILPRPLLKQLQQTTRQQSIGEEQLHPLREVSKQFPSPLSRIIQIVMQRAGLPLASIEATCDDGLRREYEILSVPSQHLGFLARLAPFCGLLATVIAMMVAFFDSTLASGFRNTLLARSISTLLAATAAGILIAAVAMTAAHFSNRRLRHLFNQMRPPLLELCLRASQEGGNS